MAKRAFEPAKLGPITLRNAIVKAATFEGVTRNGEITDALVAFHRSVAAGGAGMTTVAYLAVSPEGRTDRHCVTLSAGQEVLPGLRRIADAVHSEGAAISAQLGHAGPVANGRSNRAPALSASRGISALGSVMRAASESDIERITDDYRKGALLLEQAGFDAIEIHMGHNYLISAFMSPKLNRRSDRWGGELHNRARLARQIAHTVRGAVGNRLAVTAKMNMADGVAGGLWLEESIEIARMLESDGHLDAIELTGGSSLANPMYLFRGEAPLEEFGATLPPLVRAGFKVAGSRFLRSYPFEEAFFLPYARQFRDALEMPLVLLGGINRLDTIELALTEGFSLVAMARALLREPDLVNKMRNGRSNESLCIHCNKCMPTIYRGTHCVLVN